MSLSDLIQAKGIREVLHFTTNSGLAGILATKAVKSRAMLPSEKGLEHVYSPNCQYRKDTAWLDYVNLSISRINLHLFGISSEKWHADEDLWWVVLSFDPIVLTHDGVYFTTTNNMYTGVRRGLGEEGFEALFAQKVTRWAGNDVSRTATKEAFETTCPQAEALYPHELSTDFLRKIYVLDEEHADTVAAQLTALDHPAVEVVVEPMAFQ